MEGEIVREGVLFTLDWRSYLVRGFMAVIFGILVLAWTELALEVLVMLFGGLIIITGVMSLICAIRSMESGSMLMLVIAILQIVLGIVAISSPWIMASAIALIIAILLLITGFGDIAVAVFNTDYPNSRILLVISGALSVILGGIFVVFPLLGAVVLVAVYLGIFAIAFGILSIVVGFQLKVQQS